jgi:hypothetical protein
VGSQLHVAKKMSTGICDILQLSSTRATFLLYLHGMEQEAFCLYLIRKPTFKIPFGTGFPANVRLDNVMGWFNVQYTGLTLIHLFNAVP